MRDELLEPRPADEAEAATELGLRPRRLDDFVGQAELKEHLAIILEAARRRAQAADHQLFAGPPGLGKTSLAHIVAIEMDVGLHVTSGPALERGGDLAAILSQLGEGDVLFIDEIGLDKVDRAILTTICLQFGGGPVGLSTVAISVGEQPETVEDVYEPFLIQRGLLMRTPRGRVATPAAFTHAGVAMPPRPGTQIPPGLFDE